MDNLDSAVGLMKRGCFLASIDLKDAYYSIPITRRDRKYLRFWWGDRLFQYTCLPNGLAQAPRFFTKFLKPVFASLQQRGMTCFGYIDDTFLMHETFEGCLETVHCLKTLLTDLGFIVHPSKSVLTPTQKITFWGFGLDSLNRTVRPTVEKIQRFKTMARNLLEIRRPTIRQVAGLIGTMVDLTKGVEYGKNHYRRLEQDKIQFLKLRKGDFDAKMTVSGQGREDISWWLEHVDHGVRRIWESSPSHTLLTDASNGGWGAVTRDRKTNGVWSKKETFLHINAKETLACFLGLETFFREATDCQILCQLDNTTAVAYINHMGGTKSDQCQDIAAQIWAFCERRKLWVWAVHIPGKENQEADFQSRNFRENIEWSMPTDLFHDLQGSWGPFSCDLFASRLNFKCAKYFSWYPDPNAWKIDAFAHKWDFNSWFAFPPFRCVTRTLQKALVDGSTGVLVTPNWTAQPWYGGLVRVAKVRRLLGKITLVNPASEEEWQVDLAAWKI